MGVLVNPAIAIDVSAKLTELGGTAEVHEVTEEAVAEVETAVPAVEAAEIAAGDDLSILDGVGPKYADALKAGGVTTFAQLSQMTRRGHRREAERGERATDRRPHRRDVAAAGDARIPPGLVGVAALHRLHQDGGRRLTPTPTRYPRRPRPSGSGALWFRSVDARLRRGEMDLNETLRWILARGVGLLIGTVVLLVIYRVGLTLIHRLVPPSSVRRRPISRRGRARPTRSASGSGRSRTCCKSSSAWLCWPGS